MSKENYFNLKLHDKMELDIETDVVRVESGYIYKFYDLVLESHRYNTYSRGNLRNVIFVPCNANRERMKWPEEL